MSATLTPPAPPVDTEPQVEATTQVDENQDPKPGVFHRIGLLQSIGTITWIGLVTGYLEAAVVLGRALLLGHFLKMDIQFVWMAPLGEALMFLVAGLPLLVLARYLPRKTWMWAAVCSLSFIGYFLTMFRKVARFVPPRFTVSPYCR